MKRVIVFLVLFFLLAGSANGILSTDLEDQIREKETEIQQLEAQAEAYRQDLKSAQGKKDTLQGQINIIQSRINKLRNDIYITNARIDNASLKIEGLSLDIDEKENEIDKKKASIAVAIQALYELDQESLIEIILVRNSLSEFVNQLRYLELLQEGVQKDLTILQSLKTELSDQKQETEYYRGELYSLNNQLYSQKNIVNDEREEKDYLLHKTEGEEAQYQSLLNDVLKQQQEIHQEVYDLEFQLQKLIDPSALPEGRPGVLSWPLDGILTQNYGVTPYSKRLYKSGVHNAIDIASSYGEPIRAARDGVVLAIGSCGRYAYGKWVAIKHDNGLTTFYAHLASYAAIKVGQSVTRGQIIAYEGSTGYSTGAHLHFGVYVTETFRVEQRWYGQLPLGAHLNPMDYL